MDKMQYTYLDNAGRGLAPRHLLAFAGANDWVEKNYGWADVAATYPTDKSPLGFMAPAWGKDKPELMKKNPFTLLPYIITEKGEVISSNSGCLTYLGLRYGFKTGVEAGQLDTQILAAIEKMQDFREGFLKKVIAGTKEEIDSYAQSGFQGTLKFFEDICANSSCKYLFTDAKPSVADFSFFSTLSVMMKWHSKLLADFPSLQKWVDTMLMNEGLKKEVEKEKSEALFGHPENMAMFGLKDIVWGTPGKMDAMY